MGAAEVWVCGTVDWARQLLRGRLEGAARLESRWGHPVYIA